MLFFYRFNEHNKEEEQRSWHAMRLVRTAQKILQPVEDQNTAER